MAGSQPHAVTDDDGSASADEREDRPARAAGGDDRPVGADEADERSAPDDEADDRSGDGGVPRHDRLTAHPTPGSGNSLAHWPDARHPLRVAINYVVVWLIRISPSLRLKNWLLRRLGATVGSGVAFGLEATPDVFFPDLITVEDHAIVGYDVTILCHEFLQEEYRTGEVVIGERAMIGAGATVLPGVEIGAGAQVAANSLVTEDVPPGATVAGVPATEMSSEEID